MNIRLETMWASLMFIAIGVALASGAVACLVLGGGLPSVYVGCSVQLLEVGMRRPYGFRHAHTGTVFWPQSHRCQQGE
jgi:hypothetical protein